MDEIRDAKTGAVQVIQGRLSSPHADIPQLLATTSPNGYDHIYDIWIDTDPRHPSGDRVPDDREHSSTSGLHQNLRRGYDPDMVGQELEGKIVNLGKGQVYRRFNRRVHARKLKYDPDAPSFSASTSTSGTWDGFSASGRATARSTPSARSTARTRRSTRLLTSSTATGGGHRGLWNYTATHPMLGRATLERKTGRF